MTFTLFQPDPVFLHYVEKDMFTDIAWSLTQPSVVFFSDEKGFLQVWDIKKRKSQPLQKQDISGQCLNGIA